MNKKIKNNNLKIFVVILYFLLIIGFLIPKDLKQHFYLEKDKPKIYTIYSHIFIHIDFLHFFLNVTSFSILLFLFLFYLKIKSRIFVISLILTLIITPLFTALFWYFISKEKNISGNTQGFSGINAALTNLLLYFIINYNQNIKSSKKLIFHKFSLILSLITMLLIIILSFVIIHNPKECLIISLILSIIIFFSIFLYLRKTFALKEKLWKNFVMFSEFIICFFGLSDHSMNVDLISHFVGLFTGVYIGFLLFNLFWSEIY